MDESKLNASKAELQLKLSKMSDLMSLATHKIQGLAKNDLDFFLNMSIFSKLLKFNLDHYKKQFNRKELLAVKKVLLVIRRNK